MHQDSSQVTGGTTEPLAICLPLPGVFLACYHPQNAQKLKKVIIITDTMEKNWASHLE